MRREDEFAELLTGCQERLFAYVFAWVRDANDTQDVLQQTAVVLWEKFDQFDRGTEFFPWAIVVAKYQTLNFLRYRKNYRARFSNEFMESLAIDEALTDADLEVDRREALNRCVQKLSEGDQKLLKSRYGTGLRVVQIADLTGRSLGSVSNSLRRIRGVLLECVERAVERESRI